MARSSPISIHAQRSDATYPCVTLIVRIPNFNPRTAWAMRHSVPFLCLYPAGFQSTHRVSDANRNFHICWYTAEDFNPRTAWAMRTSSVESRRRGFWISIHAPRERCERKNKVWNRQSQHFNPRTAWAMRTREMFKLNTSVSDFNPRTAWAMRTKKIRKLSGTAVFQSTHRVSDANRK